MIKKVLLWHVVIVIPITLGAFHFFALHQFLSFSYGVTLVFVNTGLMLWGWNLVMTQQKGQKAILILGIKYLILLGFISLSGFISWLETGFFLAGLTTFLIPLTVLSAFWWMTLRSKKL